MLSNRFPGPGFPRATFLALTFRNRWRRRLFWRLGCRPLGRRLNLAPRTLPAFSPCRSRFFRGKAMCRAALVRNPASLAAGFAGFFLGELVCRSLLVRSLAPPAGDRALLGWIHRREPTLSFAGHNRVPFSQDKISLFP